MLRVVIKNNKCPFCKFELENSRLRCPNNKYIPFLECKECLSYFYTEHWYEKLSLLAKEYKSRLRKDIYIYQKITPEKNRKAKIETKTRTNKPTTNKHKNKILKVKMFTTSLPIEKISVSKQSISKNEVKQCRNYKNGICIYINDNCNPYSIKCKKSIVAVKKDNNDTKTIKSKIRVVDSIIDNEHFVTAIVLTNIRKCAYENHTLTDVTAYCNVVGSNGKVYIVEFPAAYCLNCDQYFVLKTDFLLIKEKGVLLCKVEDKTHDYLATHTKSYSAGESEIHVMGYNVIKKYDYSNEQRKIILANIIENTNITKQEILSIIDMNIARHKNQKSYIDAVCKWTHDRDFIQQYKTGDYPEIIIDKFIIGRR